MATTKITDLTAYTDPVNTDVLPIVDVTSDVTKKVSVANVMKNASLGTAAAPGISFDGDPNTGVYSPGADQVAVTTGGTQRLLIDSAGAVTIAGDLTVNGTTTNINTQNLVVEDKNIVLGDVTTPTDVTADGGGITLKGTTDKTINWVDSTDAWTSSERFSYPTGSAAAPTLTFTGDTNTGIYSPGADQVAISTGGSGRLFVDASGNVGIGGAPVANFEVTSPQPSFRLSDTNGTVDNNKYQIYINSSQDLQFQALSDAGVGGGSVWKFTRNASQIENFVGTRSGTDRITLSNWDNKVTFSNALGVLGTATAHDLQITTNNTERLRITSAGLVGIGTSSPGQPLDVQAGTSNVSIRSTTTSAGSAPRIILDHAGNDAFGIIGGTDLRFLASNTTERVRITSAGNVGIGTTSPGTTLDVNGGAQVTGSASGYNGGEIRLGATTADLNHAVSTQSTGTPTMLFDHRGTGNTGQFAWRVGTGGASERMRIDSSGRLLVGTSTGSGTALFEVRGNISGSTNGGHLRLSRGEATPASGDGLGFIDFSDNTSSAAAQITARRDGGTWSASSKPSRLEFSVTSDGASSPTERMRIRQDGMIGMFSADDTLQARNSNGAGAVYAFIRGIHSATGTVTGGTTSFIVYSNGNVLNTNGSYTAISDAKLKENIVDASSQWNDLKAIKIRNWNFKVETGHETHRQIGPIAQELEEVCPGLVFEAPDRDADGNETGEVTKGVNQSVLYMKAVKALQEAMERIEVLEQRLTDAGIA